MAWSREVAAWRKALAATYGRGAVHLNGTGVDGTAIVAEWDAAAGRYYREEVRPGVRRMWYGDGATAWEWSSHEPGVFRADSQSPIFGDAANRLPFVYWLLAPLDGESHPPVRTRRTADGRELVFDFGVYGEEAWVLTNDADEVNCHYGRRGDGSLRGKTTWTRTTIPAVANRRPPPGAIQTEAPGLARAAELATDGLSTQTPSSPLTLGTVAPPICGTAADGREVNSTRWRGCPLLVEFWGTGCGHCLPRLHHLDDARRRFGDGVGVLACAPGERRATVARFLAARGYGFPCVPDDGRIHVAYGRPANPTVFVFDRAHRLAYCGHAPSGRDLERSLETLLSQR